LIGLLGRREVAGAGDTDEAEKEAGFSDGRGCH